MIPARIRIYRATRDTIKTFIPLTAGSFFSPFGSTETEYTQDRYIFITFEDIFLLIDLEWMIMFLL